MDAEFKKKMIQICKDKISAKGDDVGLSFYVFFSNQNTEPELLMEVAEWWILTNKLNHFEKARKVIELLKH